MKKLLAILLATTIACSLLLTFDCTPAPKFEEWDIDWTLHAAKMDTDGQILSKFEFQVAGNISYDPSDYTKPGTMQLEFAWPNGGFRYTGGGVAGNQGWPSGGGDSITFYGSNLSFDQWEGVAVSGAVVIAPEKGYMLLWWPDDEIYVIASTDPSIPCQDIENVFANYGPL